MTDIIRVWGTCDNIKIEFNYEGGKMWSCKVPPDFKDGIYVAEFWAQDVQGRIGHWSGFLYMVNGVCHFKFNQERYQIWLHPLHYIFDIKKESKKYNFDYKKEEEKEFFFDIFKEEYQIFYNTFDYKTVIEKANNFKLDFIEKKYFFDFCKEEKNYKKREIKNSNLIQRLLLRKQVKEISKSISAKLGVAILGFMRLGADEPSIKNNNSCYQISFSFDKDIYIETNPKYKIFIKKRCEHWEP